MKANASENASTRLTEEEMLAQMRYGVSEFDRYHPKFGQRTILLAGHETSATSMCWVLLELARHQDVQQKLREEIRVTEQAIHARGGSDFTAADLDNMPYLAAVLKVSFLERIGDLDGSDQSSFSGINEIPSCSLPELPAICPR